jgi:hypothetical protein
MSVPDLQQAIELPGAPLETEAEEYPLSPAEEAAILEHLRALGYVD